MKTWVGWGLTSCISHKLPVAAAAGARTTLRISEGLALHGLGSLEGRQQFHGAARNMQWGGQAIPESQAARRAIQ